MQKIEGARGRSLGVFGKNLHIVLTELKISPYELERRIGMPHGGLFKLLRGERDMQLSTLMRIFEVVPIKIEKLLYDVGHPVREMIDEARGQDETGYIRRYGLTEIKNAWVYAWGKMNKEVYEPERALASKGFKHLMEGLKR